MRKRKKVRNWDRGFLAGPVRQAGLCILLAIAAAAQEPPPAPVEFTEAKSHLIGITLELPGSVESVRRGQVASPVEGLVVELLVRDGDQVKGGQTLAKLDTSKLQAQRTTLQAQLTESAARLEAAEAKLKRANELFEAEIISRDLLDDSLFERQALEARSESLRASIAEIDLGIERSTIRAPFGGVVTRKLSEIGQWIGEGDAVVEILALDELEIAVEVPEVHISKVRINQHAEVRLEAYPGTVLAGRVSVMIPEANAEARTFAVKIAVPSGGGLVRSGMLATVKLAPRAPRTATIVPKDALVRSQAGWNVFALKDNNTVGALPVRMGDGIGEWVEIVGNLTPGDRIVTRGNERLKDGQSVSASRAAYAMP
ncbi:MAG TPA: efflux RND transporter periplasmic adaptor subunit [Bryobacterales bacterium]|nr:efflux RND transporter periplasmic adaptor subunit [Bryobacterales bacterium]